MHTLVVEHAPAAFTVSNLDGTYRWVSDGFARPMGYTPEELTGRSAYDLIHVDDHAASKLAHERLLEDGHPVVTVRGRLRCSDGTYRWVETASRWAADERAIVSTSHWVDSEESAAEYLRTERDLAGRFRRLDEQHRHFLTAISHRARHPVTIVRGVADLLSRHGHELDEPRRAKLLERLAANALLLEELVEDVTQAETLASRAERVQVRPVDLNGVLRQCLARVATPDAPITVTVPDDAVVFADVRLLRLALQALIDNAIEHTPVGTPIWVSLNRAHDGAVITVSDAGPGVHPSQRDAIFAPFERANVDDADPGLGLGLHSVAEIASVHGGRAWVDARTGGGAAFHLLLPLAAAEQLRRAWEDPDASPRPVTGVTRVNGATEPRTRPVTTGVRVLVVDDDPTICELLAMTLGVEGFDVETAYDGAEALARIAADPPDVMIADVMMPELDGRDLTRRIRANPAVQDLPIILCSAMSEDRDQWRAWRTGADSFVAKPFDPDELIVEVQRLLTARRGTRDEHPRVVAVDDRPSRG